MKNKVTINADQKVYVIPTADGKGFSCLGFDRVIDLRNALAAELGTNKKLNGRRGSMLAYNEYRTLADVAKMRFDRDGFRSEVELTPQLKGYEGFRVEVMMQDGRKRRFIVGKSTGWIPCHLEVKASNHHGGHAVYGAPFKSVRIVERVR